MGCTEWIWNSTRCRAPFTIVLAAFLIVMPHLALEVRCQLGGGIAAMEAVKLKAFEDQLSEFLPSILQAYRFGEIHRSVSKHFHLPYLSVTTLEDSDPPPYYPPDPTNDAFPTSLPLPMSVEAKDALIKELVAATFEQSGNASRLKEQIFGLFT